MASFWMGCASNIVLASVLAVAAWMAAKCWQSRPAIAHALWLLVLLKLVTPPLIELPLPTWATVLTRDTASTTSGTALELEPPKAPPELLRPTTQPTETISENEMDEDYLGPPLGMEVQKTESILKPIPTEEETAPTETAPTWYENIPLMWSLLVLWGMGCLGWWSLVAWRVCRFQRLLRFADPANERVQRLARQGAKRLELATCPPILCISAGVSPMVWAWSGRPVVILPSALIGQLSDMELATLLLHEFAHVQRGDHWIRWLEVLTLGLQWWNPLAWWAKRELQQAEEACCDAWVLWAMPQHRASYAVAMVRAMDLLAAASTPLPAGASGLGQVQLLKRRIRMLHHGTTARALPRGGSWLVLAFAMLVLPLGTLVAAQDDDPPRRPQGAGSVTTPRPPQDQPPGQPVQPPPAQSMRAGRGGGMGMGPGMGGQMQPPISDDQKRDMLFEAEMAVKQAELQVRSRQIQIEAAQAETKSAESTVKRHQELYNKGAISITEYEMSQFHLNKARVQIQQAQIETEQAELHLLMARRRLEQFKAGRFPTGGPGVPGGLPPMPGAGGGMSGGMAPTMGGPGGGPLGGMPGGMGRGTGGLSGGQATTPAGGLGGPMGPQGGRFGGGASTGSAGFGGGSGTNVRRGGEAQARALRLIQQFDRNGDGKLSRDEFPDFFPSERFDEYDLNKDGFVDAEELTKVFERMTRDRGGRGSSSDTTPAGRGGADETPGAFGGGGRGRPGVGSTGRGALSKPGSDLGLPGGAPGSGGGGPAGLGGGGRRGERSPEDIERQIEEMERAIQQLTGELQKAREELKKRKLAPER